MYTVIVQHGFRLIKVALIASSIREERSLITETKTTDNGEQGYWERQQNARQVICSKIEDYLGTAFEAGGSKKERTKPTSGERKFGGGKELEQKQQIAVSGANK